MNLAPPRGLVEAFERADVRWPLYVACLLIGMYVLGQLTDPFIAHDDFDWLNFQFDQAFESPWSKSFSEGRWLNVPWSYLSHHLSIRGAFLLHLLVYGMFVWILPKLLIGRSSVICSLLLFVAPMAAETSMWPVTQVTGALVSLVSCWVMLSASRERERLIGLSAGVFVGYLCYPSFGPVLLLVASTHAADPRALARTGVTYVVTFVSAVLFVFLLNLLFHGSFAIKPASWREATPLLQGGSLQVNVERYLKYYDQLLQMWPVLVVSTVGYVACFASGIRRMSCSAVLAMSVMLLAMDASLSVVSGLGLWLRASLWIWIVLSFPVIALIGSTRRRALGLLLAAPLILFGMNAWAGIYQNVRGTFPAVRTLAQDMALAQARVAGSFDSIVVFGDVHDSHFLRHMNSNRALRNLLFKEYGWVTQPCEPTLCEKIEAEIADAARPPGWIVVERRFVIVISNHRGSLY